MTPACRRSVNLVDMSYDNQTRDRYRTMVTGVTGVAGIGALTLTGGLMGAAADDSDQEQPAVTGQSVQARDGQRPGRFQARPVPRQRPYVTRVTIRYVPGAGTAAPGPGGAVAPATSGGSAGTSRVAAPAAAPAAPAPPQPAPAPAPSSGS